MKTWIALLCCCCLSGCGSLVSVVSNGHPNRTDIVVPPGSTAITLADGRIVDGDEDGVVEISRGAGPFRSNSGRVENNKDETIGVIRSGVTPWVLGNLLPNNGVVLGFGTDFIGGGAFAPKFIPLTSIE